MQRSPDRLNGWKDNIETADADFLWLYPAASVTPPSPSASPNYGARADGTPKGNGFLGALDRPDGGVMTAEYSIGVGIDGNEIEIPTLVPTLTQAEVDTIFRIKPGEKLPEPIIKKAVDHARSRIADGKSPFGDPGFRSSGAHWSDAYSKPGYAPGSIPSDVAIYVGHPSGYPTQQEYEDKVNAEYKNRDHWDQSIKTADADVLWLYPAARVATARRSVMRLVAGAVAGAAAGEGLKATGVFSPDLPCKPGRYASYWNCLLYTSPSPRDGLLSRMPSSA